MSKFWNKNNLIIFLVIVLAVTTGCGKKEEAKPVTPGQTAQKAQVTPPAGLDTTAIAPSGKDAPQIEAKDIVVSVDGVGLKKEELTRKVKAQMNLYKDKIPADKRKEIQQGLRKQLTEEFVMRTVLTNEANRQKIVATDKEIQTAMNQLKANLPPDKKIEDFLKENNIPREDIVLGIRIKKMVEKEAGSKTKATPKEISTFYDENKDKFTTEENVHVRHILIMIDAKDDEKVKADKKAKIEKLREQIVGGADFAEVARNNSDCPSKENGGDLGDIKRGQTVKPFEDAAFSQEKNAIGPVVTTEFGHHVIQVLEHKPAKTVKLDEVKDKIALYLEQQKQQEVFSKMTARLRKNAVVVYHEKL